MRTKLPVWPVFATAVWVFIGLNAYKIVVHIAHANQIIGAYPAGYDYKVLLAPFFLLGLELFLWLRMFRYAVHPARLFAGVVGAYVLFMVVVVNIIVADMNDTEMSGWLLFLYAYVAVGHLTYALFGDEFSD